MLSKNNILKTIFPFLRLKDNMSIFKKIGVYIETFFMASIFVWLFSIAYIKLTYNKSIFEHLNIYSKNVNNLSTINNILNKVEKNLNNYSINLKTIKANLYFVDNSLVYKLTSFPALIFDNPSAFAYSTLFGSIYFNYYLMNITKVKKSIIYSPQAIISHELAHLWQNEHYSAFKTPLWVREGYPVYVSGILKGLKVNKFLKDKVKTVSKDKRTFDNYIVWGLMVKHAIEDLNYSVDDLHLNKVDYDKVFKSLLAKYK